MQNAIVNLSVPLVLAMAATSVQAGDTAQAIDGSVRNAKVLMVVTSADRMNNGKPTGLWLEEFAVPYLAFRDSGFEVTVASIRGGAAPVDPRSEPTEAQQAAWSEAAGRLAHTVPLKGLKADDYEAIFIPGGHGTMFDMPHNRDLGALLAGFAARDKPIGAVCHGPSAFVGVEREDGRSLVDGRTITAFTNREEAAVDLVADMPFLLETKLTEAGGEFVGKPNFTDHAVRDGNLVTGQNPASSASAAALVIEAISERHAQPEATGAP